MSLLKAERCQLCLERPLVLKRIAVCSSNNTTIKQDSKDLSTFLEGKYGNVPSKFVNDLSIMIGKSKEKFALCTKDLVTLLTTNLSIQRKKIVLESVKTAFQILYPVSPKETIHLADNFKGYRLLNEPRKIVPGVLPSQNDEMSMRHDCIKSVNAHLLPFRTSTGWQVNVACLLAVFEIQVPFHHQWNAYSFH